MDRGNLLIEIRRHGMTWRVVLPMDLGARLLAWLTERRPRTGLKGRSLQWPFTRSSTGTGNRSEIANDCLSDSLEAKIRR